jgi:hypothetical protein
MEIQSKYFRRSSTTTVIRCSCSQVIIHDLRQLSIRCFTCEATKLFETALEELLLREQRHDAPILPESVFQVG